MMIYCRAMAAIGWLFLVPMLTPVLAFTAAPLTAWAHGEKVSGPHGGEVKDIGTHHVELVVAPPRVTIYVSDRNDKPVDTQGFQAKAALVQDGKRHKLDLVPGGGNALSGTASFTTKQLKVIISLKSPGGKFRKALYTVKK